MLVVWLLRPTDSLAHDVVTHIEYESASWSSHDQISADDVKEALAKAGAVLDMSAAPRGHDTERPYHHHGSR
jgi:hypothetical protein